MKPARRAGRARSYIAYSSCRQTHPKTNSPRAKSEPPTMTRNKASAIAGRAASTRAPRSERFSRRAWPPAGAPRARAAISGPSPPAESAAALRELSERLLECLAREVGPELVPEHELGIGRLPQQVVGQALLAACADDQIGVVHLRRIQAGAELLFARAAEAARGVEDLGAPSVVEGDEQGDAHVAVGELFGPAHALDELGRYPLAPADETHADAFAVQLRRLLDDPCRKHIQESLNLLGRARPVLG